MFRVAVFASLIVLSGRCAEPDEARGQKISDEEQAVADSEGKIRADSRLENIDLLFDQVRHAQWAITLLVNRPTEITLGSSCIEYTHRPGKRKFLIADYRNCAETKRINGVNYRFEYAGTEEFFESEEDENLQVATNGLTVTMSQVGTRARSVVYRLHRKLSLEFPLGDEPSAKDEVVAKFHQVNQLDPEAAADRAKVESWTTDISGAARLLLNSQNETPTYSFVGLEEGAKFKLSFARFRNDVTSQKRSLIRGRIDLSGTTKIEFTGLCGHASGRFNWRLEEQNRKAETGSFESDGTEIKDPSENDPALQKPRPWASC